MSVPSNHAYVTGGEGICDRILAVIDAAENLVGEQAVEKIESLHQQMQAKAQTHDRWRELASDIEYWPHPQGGVAFGVPPDSPRAEQAMRAEYGDEEYGPTGLIRMGVLGGTRRLGWEMQEAFRRQGF